MHKLLGFALALSISLSAVELSAQASDSVKLEARERFDRGLRLFNQGDDSGALAEFKRAYELIPHPLVLYNLAVVYAAMKRPVEAVDSLDRLLASPGDVPAEKLGHARKLRGEQASRISELAVIANVTGARIELDGVEVGQVPLAQPLRIPSGEHVVAVIAPGHAPARQRVSVAGGRRAKVDLRLEPVEGRLAMLTVATRIPDAEILVDGKPAGKTPLAGPVALAPGRRVVDVVRAGYRPFRRVLDLTGGATAALDVDLELDPGKLASDGGKLSLEISEAEAVVFVNGEPRGAYAGPLALPAGRHRVRIERAEFFAFERDVDVPRGGAANVVIELQPTPEKRVAYRDRTTSQRTWGWVSLGAGGAIAIASGAFLIWNASEQADAEERSDELLARTGPGGDCSASSSSSAECARVRKDLELVVEEKDTINARYPWGFAALGVGVLGAGLGTYLLLSNDDPDRYEPRPESDVFGRVRWAPQVAATPAGASIGVVGAF